MHRWRVRGRNISSMHRWRVRASIAQMARERTQHQLVHGLHRWRVGGRKITSALRVKNSRQLEVRVSGSSMHRWRVRGRNITSARESIDAQMARERTQHQLDAQMARESIDCTDGA